MAGNPDFELVVGIEPVASLSEMKKGLRTIISELNNDPQKVKIQLDFGSKQFLDYKKELMSGLGEIQKLVNELNQKQFGFNFNISDATTMQEQIAGIRGQVLDYAKALEQAQSVIVNLNNSGMKNALAEQGADLGKAVGMMMNYRTELVRITESIEKQNTLTGLKIKRDELEQLRAAIVPVLEAANRLGAVKFDTSKLIPPELPARLESSAEKITSILSGMTGSALTAGAREQAKAIEQTAQAVQTESQKVADASKGYNVHKIAVEAAAAAEAGKAKESQAVQASLNGETQSVERSTAATKKHTDAYADAVRAVKEYYSALASLDKNEAARNDITLGQNGYVSKTGNYAELAAELNRTKTAFDLVTSAEAKSKLTGEELLAVIGLIANKQREYALSVEENENKRAAAAEKAAEREKAAAEKAAQAKENSTKRAEAAAEKAAEREKAAAEKAAQAKEKAEERAAAAAERAATKEAEAKERAAKAESNANIQRERALQQTETLLQRVQAAQQKWSAAQKNTVASSEYAKLSKYEEELQKIANALRSGAPLTNEMRERLAALNAEFAHSTTVIQGSGSAVRSYFSSGLNTLNSRLSYTFGFASIVMKTVAEIKKMISTAVELDTAMNNLQIVTRASSDDMAEYSTRVSQMAKETAQSTKDLIDATTVYARLGYTLDESQVLAKYTAMLQGVGDIDASAAQDAMTAIIKAFNVRIDEVESVMDKMVTVGNGFPISVSQLAEGMNNAGSMLAVAGNDLEHSIALLVASNVTVQNISKASTGLRTIAARIRKTDSGIGDDGEAVTEAHYQKMVNVLTQHQVSLVDELTGEYRSTYDVLKDIAAVWEELNSMEQAAVIEALAGTRQQNIFSSIITQFQEAEKAVNAMGESTGALSDAYDIYLESIQAHVNVMNAAFDELSKKFLNGEFAKESVDFLTDILELLTALVGPLNKIVGFLGPLGTFFVSGGIIAFIKNIGQPNEGALISEIYKSAYHWQGYAVMVA